MSTSKRVAAGATWLLGTQVFTAVAQLGYAAFTSRHADHAAFGQYAIALSATTLLSLIANSGLGVAASRMSETHESVTRPLMGLALFTGSLTALILITFANPWARLWGDVEASSAIRFLALGLVLSPAVGVQAGLLRREGKFRLLAASMIATSALAMLVGSFAVWLWPSALSLTTMTVCATLFQFGVFAVFLGRRGTPTFALKDATAELGFGTKALVGSLILYLGMTAPVVAMSRAISVTVLGEWNRAGVLGYVPLQMVTSSAQQALYPEFRSAAEDSAGTREVWGRLFGLSVILIWPISAAALPWFPFVTRVLLGPDWELAGSIAKWLLAATAIYFPLAILWAAQESAAMFKQIWIGFGTYSAVMFVVAMAVVVTRDWRSAAVGMVVASAITLTATLWMLVRLKFLEPSAILRDLGQSVAASIALGLISVALVAFVANAWMGLFASLLVSALLYLRLLRHPAVSQLLVSIRNAN